MLNTLKSYARVLWAIMLHDIKSRFFGNGLGQIFMIAWPVAHILALLGIYYMTGRVAAYGDSLVLYSAIGVTPFIIWSYSSRWIVFAGMQNRFFLGYPIIRPLDILIGRTVLEFITTIIICVVIWLFLLCCGVSPLPHDLLQVFLALGVSFLLATGFGLIGGVLTYLTPMVAMSYTLIIIVAYASSGILFIPSSFPAQIGYLLSFNPVLQLVEWSRYAFFFGYPTAVLDRAYVVEFSLVMVAVGLIMERGLRRYF